MDDCADDSSDGWDEDWDEYVILPPGIDLVDDVPNNHEKYLREHFLRQKYGDGTCKFNMRFEGCKWVITRVLKWDNICKFPKGHEIRGYVLESQVMQILQDRFKEQYVITSNPYEVKQVCPCGKTECDIHIFPSKVLLESSFTLAVYSKPTKKTETTEKKEVEQTFLEPIFRKNHAMTFEQVKDFFDQFELNWKVFITALKITFWMVCKCGQAFEETPCDTCINKWHRKCHMCNSLRRSRMLVKCHPTKNCTKCRGICSDCKAAEITYCEFCKKDARLDHKCTPLVNQYVKLRKSKTYPPPVRTVGSMDVICKDCKKCMKYSIYKRHQQRRHNDKSPCDLYDRDHKKIGCNYCWYYHYDPTNVKDHAKLHSIKKTHACKAGCSMTFTHASSEIKHRKEVHGAKLSAPKRRRRVGSRVVLMKRQKSDPAP